MNIKNILFLILPIVVFLGNSLTFAETQTDKNNKELVEKVSVVLTVPVAVAIGTGVGTVVGAVIVGAIGGAGGFILGMAHGNPDGAYDGAVFGAALGGYIVGPMAGMVIGGIGSLALTSAWALRKLKVLENSSDVY